MTHEDQAIPMGPRLADSSGAASDAPPLDTDTQLMIDFRDGRREAFDDLVRRNHGKVFSLLYRFLGNTSDCEDLTQEVFLRVLRSAARYVPTAKFNTWLYRIAANAALNQMRSRSRGRPVSLEIDGGGSGEDFQREIPDTRHGGPADRSNRRELAGQVADAVAQLPEKQRLAIVLNKYEGLCYEDISQVLGCSTMAVKSLLSRARGNLRDRLVRYVDGGLPVGATDDSTDNTHCNESASERNLHRSEGFGNRRRSSRSSDPASTC